ncbi:MAG TPA: FAD-binding oxidoreductase [Gemmatimonadales bacterium]|nr:FAD-binding oxidoreductase [Gemmatimonadales bacterium]
MTTPPSVLRDFRTRAAYSEAAGIHRIVPAGVAVPRSPEELQALVRWATAAGTTLVPRGAGSAMPGNAVGAGIVVDLNQGFRYLDVDPGARVARTGASVTWAALAAAARAHGLRLPPDPSSGAFATAGGMVATNAAGPRSVCYGSVRPWVAGLEVVGADGEARWIRRGAGSREPGAGLPFRLDDPGRRLVAERFPRTRKNSMGYALDAFAASGDEVDLFVGAEGTLGVVMAVEWRLDPIPPHRAGAALGFATLDGLQEAVTFLVTLRPAAVELMDETLLRFVIEDGGTVPPGLAALLLVEFERDTAAAARGAVADAVRGLRALTSHVETAPDAAGLPALWRVRTLASPALARLPETRRSLQVIEDGCVPLDRLGAYLAGVRDAADRLGIVVALFGHAGDGHVHVNALPDITRPGWREAVRMLYDAVSDLVIHLGGTPAGEHGAGRLRAGLVERLYGAEIVARFRAVKRAYDPGGVFNPDVILPADDWEPLAGMKIGPAAAPIPDDIAARLRDLERTGAWQTPKTELAR